MTKQQAVTKVRTEIQRLRDEGYRTDILTRTACHSAADKLQWALDLLTNTED